MNDTIRLLLLLGIGFLVRLPFLDSVTPDTRDFVLPWYSAIAEDGYRALGGLIPNIRGETAGNYSPPYYYLLYLGSLIGGSLPALYVIKLISFSFDCLAVITSFKIVFIITGSKESAWRTAVLVSLLPTLMANSAWWGQCDSIWVSLLLLCFYGVLSNKKLLALSTFGVAVAIKLQAIFLSPLLLLLLLSNQISYKDVLLAPTSFIVAMLPAIMLGQSLPEIFGVYVRQGLYFNQLSMNAPNLYSFAPNSHYEAIVFLGLIATTIVMACLAALPVMRKRLLDHEQLLLAALVFVSLAPFLLPKMHDRYFIAADVFVVLVAVCIPKYWIAAAAFQFVSLIAYVPVFIHSGALKTQVLTTVLMPYATILNTAVTMSLVASYVMCIKNPKHAADTFQSRLAPLIGTVLITGIVWISSSVLWGWSKTWLCPGDGILQSIVCDRSIPLDYESFTRLHYAVLVIVLFSAGLLMRLSSRRINENLGQRVTN